MSIFDVIHNENFTVDLIIERIRRYIYEYLSFELQYKLDDEGFKDMIYNKCIIGFYDKNLSRVTFDPNIPPCNYHIYFNYNYEQPILSIINNDSAIDKWSRILRYQDTEFLTLQDIYEFTE